MKKTIKKETKKDNYDILISFNGEDFKKKVKDTEKVGEFIQSVKPILLKTKVILKVKKGDKTVEKVFAGIQAKRLWLVPRSFKIVINRIISQLQ